MFRRDFFRSPPKKTPQKKFTIFPLLTRVTSPGLAVVRGGIKGRQAGARASAKKKYDD